MGEVWSETIGELQLENVRPVTPDQEAMEAISRAIEERAVIVAATQQELIEAQKNQDVIDEQEFYAQVKILKCKTNLRKKVFVLFFFSKDNNKQI